MTINNQDRVIILGTGKNQQPLIRAARDIGCYIIAIDRNPNPHNIDYVVRGSTHSYEDIEKEILSLHQEKEIKTLLFRSSGKPIITAAKICELLRLDAMPAQLAQIAYSKDALQKAKFDCAMPEGDVYEQLPESVDFPCVLKPDIPVVGKQNVYKIENQENLRYCFSLAARESLNERVVIQNYIGGQDVSVMCWIYQGKLKWDFVYEELNHFENERLANKGNRVPAKGIEPPRKIIENIISRCKIDMGVIFLSFRFEREKAQWWLYEINPGLCGDNICDEHIPKVYPNFNPFVAYTELMLNRLPRFPD